MVGAVATAAAATVAACAATATATAVTIATVATALAVVALDCRHCRRPGHHSSVCGCNAGTAAASIFAAAAVVGRITRTDAAASATKVLVPSRLAGRHVPRASVRRRMRCAWPLRARPLLLCHRPLGREV